MDDPKVTFERVVLSNGLQLILHVDNKLPVVHVNTWFHVGSKNERPGRTGFAHLFEHLMFEGSKNAPGGYFSRAEKAGANLRERGVNGTTGNDRTNYFATVPSANLEYLLWLESDRVATLTDTLTQASLDNQREVVRNERRQSYENQPYGRADMLLSEHLFEFGHPYSWPVIGSHEDLAAATLDDVKEFFRTFYTPNNMSLCISGDFDPVEAKRLVEKYYGALPPGPGLDRPRAWTTRLEKERVIEVADRVPQERVYLAWPAPPIFDPDEPALRMAARILSDGYSSRLPRALVYDRPLCSGVSADFEGMEIAGAFLIEATARPGVSLAEVEQQIHEQLARLIQDGPTQAELKRAKTKWEFSFITGLERIGGFGGKADMLNRYNTYLGDPDGFRMDLERHRGVTRDAVRQALARCIGPGRVVLRFRPDPAQRADVAPPDRAIVPALGQDRDFVPPSISTGRLDNGLEVRVVHRSDLPKVSVLLNVRGGVAEEPPQRGGLATLTMATIDLGTRTRSAIEIEEAMGDQGSSLSAATEREGAGLAFSCLKRNLDKAFEILADVARNPTFPDTEVAREKDRLADALMQEAQYPMALGQRLAMMLRFGPDHPYGRPARGLPATVKTLSREELVAFYERTWRPDGALLVMAGDVTLEQAMDLARRWLGGWSGKPDLRGTVGAADSGRTGTYYVADLRGAAQTAIVQTLPAPSRRTPDFDALRLADAVWGGGTFMSRLNLNLREDKGYTYGASSALGLYRFAGVWLAASQVQKDKTAAALVEFEREMAGLAGARPVSDAELDQARVNRIRGFAQQFEGLGRIVGQVAELWRHDLPLTRWQEEVAGLQATDLVAVNAAAAKYVRPSEVITVLVGDADAIVAQLREKGIGPIVQIDEEGRVLAHGIPL